MLRINEELDFISGTTADIRRNSDDESTNSHSCNRSGRRTCGKKQESLRFRDRLDILSEIGLSGGAKQR